MADMAEVELIRTWQKQSGKCQVPAFMVPVLTDAGFVKGKPKKLDGQAVDIAAHESRNSADVAQAKAAVKTVVKAMGDGKKSKAGIVGKEETAKLHKDLAKTNAKSAVADATKRLDQVSA